MAPIALVSDSLNSLSNMFIVGRNIGITLYVVLNLLSELFNFVSFLRFGIKFYIIVKVAFFVPTVVN